MITATSSGFEIRSNRLHLKIGIVAMIMGCVGLCFFVTMFSEFDSSPVDWFGAAFICLWLCLVFSGALVSFYRYSKTFYIGEEGVSYCSMFSKRYLAWRDIKDYGLSYEGRAQEGGSYSNSYLLYFAVEQQASKSKYKKKMTKDTLKISVSSDDYTYFSEKVMPFCAKKIDVVPFLPEDVPHFF